MNIGKIHKEKSEGIEEHNISLVQDLFDYNF